MIEHDDFEFAGRTDVGVKRSHNQDCFTLLSAGDAEQFQLRGHVFVVADGMGAHAVGELASKMAADSIPHIYSKHAQEGPIAALRRAFVEANQTIHNRGEANREFKGMGTTGTALVVRPEGAWVGHVGDSRCYRIRGGVCEQLSFDHSLLWELARRQRKKPEEMVGVPSNVIVRSLGPEAVVQVDVEGPHPLLPGDTFVLCSDGLCGPVHDREIGAVAGALPPDEACRFLIQLANMHGGPDNITAIVVKLPGESGPSTDQSAPPWTASSSAFAQRMRAIGNRLPWAFVSLVLGIILAGFAIYLAQGEDTPKLFGWSAEFVVFVIAGVLLVGGLIGLMVQNLRETAPAATDPAPRVAPIYRKIPCAIDEALVDRLDEAMATLNQKVTDGHLEFDHASYEQHRERAKQARSSKDWLEGFRESCRAMLILMEVAQKSRGKEESFRPSWDKKPKS